MQNTSTALTPTLVPTSERLEILSKIFGDDGFHVESLVYRFTDKFCDTYNGGYWNFFTLSNGGFYMAPTDYTTLPFSCENGFSGDLSADAAGIVVTLYALNTLANSTEREHLIEMYYLLHPFIGYHLEGGLIYSAID